MLNVLSFVFRELNLISEKHDDDLESNHAPVRRINSTTSGVYYTIEENAMITAPVQPPPAPTSDRPTKLDPDSGEAINEDGETEKRNETEQNQETEKIVETDTKLESIVQETVLVKSSNPTNEDQQEVDRAEIQDGRLLTRGDSGIGDEPPYTDNYAHPEPAETPNVPNVYASLDKATVDEYNDDTEVADDSESTNHENQENSGTSDDYARPEPVDTPTTPNVYTALNKTTADGETLETPGTDNTEQQDQAISHKESGIDDYAHMERVETPNVPNVYTSLEKAKTRDDDTGETQETEAIEQTDHVTQGADDLGQGDYTHPGVIENRDFANVYVPLDQTTIVREENEDNVLKAEDNSEADNAETEISKGSDETTDTEKM